MAGAKAAILAINWRLMVIAKSRNLLPFPYKILIVLKEVVVFVHNAPMVTTLKVEFVNSLIHYAGHTIGKAEIAQAAIQDI